MTQRAAAILNVVDEFTREALACVVARSIDADGVVRCLDELATERGAPVDLRCEHGCEFIARAICDWCRFTKSASLFIEPGSPWQNAWVESCNGRMRDEHLNQHSFASLLEAQVLTEDPRIDDDTTRR